ncbi:MAG TPA: hypothetical protein RMH99_12845 [Sandaracinaceae bacterium LLY-WYZ-13_1]|nr:hypothetical protein [Sandaracinaceae bacterium LLY-WYZ-13_1]
MKTRRATLALVALAALVASTALAQDVPRRRMGVEWRDGVPHVHFSAVDLADRSLRRKLRSGLPQTLVMRVYAYRGDGRPLAVEPRHCRVTYDLWEEVYRVEIREARRDRNESYGTLRAVLQRCLVARRIPVGRARDYADAGGQPLYFAVLLELNPLSPATVHRLRRWLSRPAGGGRIGGEAFFGSFVSLFVNRRIGSAERSLRFRSQTVRVER